MKLPCITIVDEDLYERFVEQLEEDGLSLKNFINQAIEDYCAKGNKSAVINSNTNDSSPSEPIRSSYTIIDRIITELAIQQLEQQVKHLPKNKSGVAGNDYKWVSQACIELLKLIETPLAQKHLENFDQEAALHYIEQVIL